MMCLPKTTRRSKQTKTIRDFCVGKALCKKQKSFLCEVWCDCSQHILEVNKTERKTPTWKAKKEQIFETGLYCRVQSLLLLDLLCEWRGFGSPKLKVLLAGSGCTIAYFPET